jgi:imidazolonepropionase-like amidohydrolase
MRALLVFLGACAASQATTPAGKPPLQPLAMPTEPADPPAPQDAGTVLIRGATVMTAAGTIHRPGYVLMAAGVIQEVGPGDKAVPLGALVVDATGKFVTPGLIDTHSHMGVYAMPSAQAHSDGNEMVKPTTPEVWAEHAFWPQDPALSRALAGGITTIQVLPGSGNLMGGRSFVAKLAPHVSARQMRFPGAPQGLKMACGENPKRVYGDKGGPMTRMGNIAHVRAAFQGAVEYRRKWTAYRRDLSHWTTIGGKDDAGKEVDPPEPPARDLGNETLVKVLDKEIYVHNHCYRADEMHIMLDLAKEFGFVIRSFHHALEGYKLADRLAREQVAISTWADWWGFKMEAYDGIPQNAAIVSARGGIVVIHSDSEAELRHLNQEAAKARVAGLKVGLNIEENEALRWVTANPAWALGVGDRTGTLERGKMADLVVWDGHPFSVYARAAQVFIDGHKVYDRATGRRPSDFEVGQ